MLRAMNLKHDAPWKRRMRAYSIYQTQIASRRPARGIVASDRDGVRQIYTWDVRSGALSQLTHEPEGRHDATLGPDGKYVYYLEDDRGNEIGHWVRVPYEGGAPVDLSPDLPPYGSWWFDVSRAGNIIAFLATYDDISHLYVVPVSQNGDCGQPRLVHKAGCMSAVVCNSYGGEIAVYATNELSGTMNLDLLAYDLESGDRLAQQASDSERVAPFGFSPLKGDMRLLAWTNRSGYERPLIWNPTTGERFDIELPELEGNVIPAGWAPGAERILLVQAARAQEQLYIYRIDSAELTKLNHPSGTYSSYAPKRRLYFEPDSGDIFALVESSEKPREVVALDPDTGATKRVVLPGPDVPPGRPWRSVTFPSSDGETIQAWIATPEGEGPYPTILYTHGGPAAVDTDLFLPSAHMWTDHGFAFVTVNYRGSTTFGRAFQEKIWYLPGKWEVEDMAAARAFLVKEGIAIPEKVLLTGWSYGGYLTLHGLGLKPDLWAAGMAGIVVADWVSQYEDEADSFRALDIAFFGGTPEEKMDAYVEASPITYVEQVRAPVLIIQGHNDTRCPARQVVEYEQKMRAAGKAIEVIWFDAGHGSLDIEQTIEQYEQMLKFAYRIVESDR